MNLPIEIYFKIFSLLDKRHLKQCFVVCKEWSLPALTIYYRDFKISNHNIAAAKKKLQNQEISLNNCVWIENLTFAKLERYNKKSAPTEFTSTQFLKLITYMPNLKTITVNHPTKYYKYLLSVDTDKYLTQIQKIKVEDGFSSNNYKLDSLYYHFRASLTYVDISHSEGSVISLQHNGILNYLCQFKKLTHLKYCNHTDQEISVYQLQVSCPMLTTIILIDHQNTQQEFNDYMFDSSSNLKELELHFPLLPSNYVDLIIEHLPLSVKKLYIYMDDITLYDWIEKVGIEKVLKLAKRMSQLSHASIDWIPDKEYEVKYINQKESYMTTFYKVLDSFKGDKKVFCSGYFSDFRSKHNSIHLRGDSLSVFYGLNFNDFYEGSEDESDLPIPNIALPNKSISTSGSEIFNKIEFCVCEVNANFSYEFLKYFLKSFPYLQYAQYHCINYPHHGFQLCNSTGESFQSLALIGDPNKPTTTQENIEIVKISSFIPTPNFLNLLSNNLPNLKTLSLGLKNYKNAIKKAATMDLSQFKSLERVYFNVDIILNELNPETHYIRFEFTDGEIANYQHIGGKNVEFKAITSGSQQENQDTSISFMTFKCDKIKQFTLFDPKSFMVVDLLHGIPQDPHFMETDDVQFVMRY